MSYITLGNWNKNYIYIIAQVILSIIFDVFNGLGYYFYSINLGDPQFGSHTYIHGLFYYLLILIFSLLFLLYENKINNKYITKADDSIILNKIEYIHNDISSYENKNISPAFILRTVLFYVIIEFIDQIVKRFFSFGDFWMLELIIITYLCMKMIKLKIYKHQRLAIYLVSIPFLLKTTTIVLLFFDENNHFKNGEINYKYNDEIIMTKSLFVAHWWLFPISFISFFIIMYFSSYTFINIKKIIDLKYISINKILIIYGFFGTIISALFLTISTFISCGKKNNDVYDIWDYLCIVVDNNGDRFIDSYKVYFSQNIWKDLLFVLIRGIALFLCRYFFWKYVQRLNPIFKIFIYPLIYALEKIIIMYQINDDEPMNYLNLRFFLDFSSDIAAFIGFLIYLEIIELNFCELNRDLRKNIVNRSKKESSTNLELDSVSLNDSEDNSSKG